MPADSLIYKRIPQSEVDEERGYLLQIWRPGGIPQTSYGCLFCLFDSLEEEIIRRHVANHLNQFLLHQQQMEERKSRPLQVTILDAAGKPIERIDIPQEADHGFGPIDLEE